MTLMAMRGTLLGRVLVQIGNSCHGLFGAGASQGRCVDLNVMSCASFPGSFHLQPFSFTEQASLRLLSRTAATGPALLRLPRGSLSISRCTMLLPLGHAPPVQLGSNWRITESLCHILPEFLYPRFVAQNLTTFYDLGSPEHARASQNAELLQDYLTIAMMNHDDLRDKSPFEEGEHKVARGRQYTNAFFSRFLWVPYGPHLERNGRDAERRAHAHRVSPFSCARVQHLAVKCQKFLLARESPGTFEEVDSRYEIRGDCAAWLRTSLTGHCRSA